MIVKFIINYNYLGKVLLDDKFEQANERVKMYKKVVWPKKGQGCCGKIEVKDVSYLLFKKKSEDVSYLVSTHYHMSYEDHSNNDKSFSSIWAC